VETTAQLFRLDDAAAFFRVGTADITRVQAIVRLSNLKTTTTQFSVLETTTWPGRAEILAELCR
jgi:hypothetical protein